MMKKQNINTVLPLLIIFGTLFCISISYMVNSITKIDFIDEYNRQNTVCNILALYNDNIILDDFKADLTIHTIISQGKVNEEKIVTYNFGNYDGHGYENYYRYNYYCDGICEFWYNTYIGKAKTEFNVKILLNTYKNKSGLILWNNNIDYTFTNNDLSCKPINYKQYTNLKTSLITINDKTNKVYSTLDSKTIKVLYPEFNGKVIRIKPESIEIKFDSLPRGGKGIQCGFKSYNDFIKINW